MARDKLLTIRIEDDKRQAFNNWCESKDYSYSKFLYEVIEACLSGRIDESILRGEPVDNNLADKLLTKIEQVDESIDGRIEEKLTKSRDANYSEQLPDIRELVDVKVNSAIANLREELQPILAAERQIQELSANNDLIQAIANEVKK